MKIKSKQTFHWQVLLTIVKFSQSIYYFATTFIYCYVDKTDNNLDNLNSRPVSECYTNYKIHFSILLERISALNIQPKIDHR